MAQIFLVFFFIHIILSNFPFLSFGASLSVRCSSVTWTPSPVILPEWLRHWDCMVLTWWSKLRLDLGIINYIPLALYSILQSFHRLAMLLIMFCLLQVDHWLEFSARRLCGQSDLSSALADLDKALALRTFLVGHSVTLADLCIWAALKGQSSGQDKYIYIYTLKNIV